MTRSLRILLPILIVASACGDDSAPLDAATDVGTDAADSGGDDAATDVGTDSGPTAFELSTSAFSDGDPVPLLNRCGPPLVADEPGMNVSPPLTWTAGPDGTQSYAVVIRDLSAGGLVHWVIYDIPAALTSLPEDIPDAYMPLRVDGARQAEIQGSGYFGYFGPCSGGRGNTYEWTVHALAEAMLSGVDRTSTEDAIAAAVESASTASASFTGTY